MKQLKIFLRIKKKIIINHWEYSLVPNSQSPPANFYSIPSQPDTDTHTHTHTHTRKHTRVLNLSRNSIQGKKAKELRVSTNVFFLTLHKATFFFFSFYLLRPRHTFIITKEPIHSILFFFFFFFFFLIYIKAYMQVSKKFFLGGL